MLLPVLDGIALGTGGTELARGPFTFFEIHRAIDVAVLVTSIVATVAAAAGRADAALAAAFAAGSIVAFVAEVVAADAPSRPGTCVVLLTGAVLLLAGAATGLRSFEDRNPSERAGRLAVAAGGVIAVIGSFVHGFGPGPDGTSLWAASGAQDVALTVAAAVALAGAALGRRTAALLAAASMAGFALNLLAEQLAVPGPDDVTGPGPIVLGAGGLVAIVGAALLVPPGQRTTRAS